MLRLNTAVIGEQVAWQPAGESVVQFAGPADAVVDVHGRVHPDAPWLRLHRFINTSGDFVRLASVKYLRATITANPGGTAIKLWDDA